MEAPAMPKTQEGRITYKDIADCDAEFKWLLRVVQDERTEAEMLSELESPCPELGEGTASM
jgi:hypothetical protein